MHPFRSFSIINSYDLPTTALSSLFRAHGDTLESITIENITWTKWTAIRRLRLSTQLRELALSLYVESVSTSANLLTAKNIKKLAGGGRLRFLKLRQSCSSQEFGCLGRFAHLVYLSIEITCTNFSEFSVALRELRQLRALKLEALAARQIRVSRLARDSAQKISNASTTFRARFPTPPDCCLEFTSERMKSHVIQRLRK